MPACAAGAAMPSPTDGFTLFTLTVMVLGMMCDRAAAPVHAASVGPAAVFRFFPCRGEGAAASCPLRVRDTGSAAAAAAAAAALRLVVRGFIVCVCALWVGAVRS